MMAVKTDSRIAITWTPEFTAYSPTAAESFDVRAVCSLKAPLVKPEDCRPKLDLVAVIDTSSSMRRYLDLVKNSLEFVIDQLRDTDRFSLITYDESVKTVFDLTPMTADHKAEKKDLIKRVVTGRMTNLCEGLLTGMYEVIDRGDDKADVASVMLFTDGKANAGIDKKEDILWEMKKAINPPRGHIPFNGTVNTFGFRARHDARLLELISFEGGGVYHFIPSEKEIEQTIIQCFAGILSTLSKDITIQFTAYGDNTITSVHTPRTPTWKEKNKICEVVIGDLQSEEERDILVDLKVANISNQSTTPVLVTSCELKYFNVISESNVSTNCDLQIEIGQLEAMRNKKVDIQSNRLLVTQALRQAHQLADIENFTEAKEILLRAKERISKSMSSSEAYCQKLTEDLKKAAEIMKSKNVYDAGAHYIICKGQSHAMQRSNFIQEDSSYGATSRNLYV